MQKEIKHRNHCKTIPERKNVFLFFLISWFYKTFDSDAVIISQLFWLKITIQEWARTVWFLEKSTSYFDQLDNAWYSYVVIKVSEDWNISRIRDHRWNKELELNIPSEVFQWLLDDLKRIYERYSIYSRLIQPIDLPFNNNDEYTEYKTNLIKDFELKETDKSN